MNFNELEENLYNNFLYEKCPNKTRCNTECLICPFFHREDKGVRQNDNGIIKQRKEKIRIR